MDDLVRIAERAVRAAVTRQPLGAGDVAAGLDERRAVFVTLRRRGQLRGCIGMMEPLLPVAEAVADRARAAALDDPRFAPVAADELDDLSVEVSVLSPMEEFHPGGYRQLIDELRPGIDGLLVESDRHRATFLPSVWEDLGDADQFVAALWKKADLAPGLWRAGTTRVWRYTAQHS